MDVLNLFGVMIYYDVLQVAIVLGIIVAIVLHFHEEILRRMGKGSYKPEIGDSYWTFMGKDGTHYSNARLVDRKRNPFGNWSVTLRAGGGIIVLPSVCMDTSSPDCNIKIINLSHAANGVVDVYCNIDANGKPCEWNYRFDEHMARIEAEAEAKALQRVKQALVESKEFGNKMDGNVGVMVGGNQPQYPIR